MALKNPGIVVRRLKRFVTDESGPTATEYAIMLALIILVSVGMISSIGLKFQNLYVIIEEAIPMPG